MEEAMRTYLELAMGLTEASRKRVRRVVKDVVTQAVGRSGATAEQVKALSGDLMAANSANREALAKLVRFEVDRALGMVGLATAEEVGELTQQVRDLKEQLREAQAVAPKAKAPKATAPKATAPKATAAQATPAKAASARTTRAKAAPAKATAKAIAAKEAPVANKTVVNKNVANKNVANKTVAQKAPANRTVAKKAVARKAAPA
jgi:polyhydroxyalkanoate synthesis regulator phasin